MKENPKTGKKGKTMCGNRKKTLNYDIQEYRHRKKKVQTNKQKYISQRKPETVKNTEKNMYKINKRSTS